MDLLCFVQHKRSYVRYAVMCSTDSLMLTVKVSLDLIQHNFSLFIFLSIKKGGKLFYSK
jgi:hypothetical protein